MIDPNWTPEFQRQILAAALRGDLLAQLPFDPALFSATDRLPTPHRRMADAIFEYHAAYGSRPSLEAFSQLMAEAAARLSPEERAVVEQHVAAVLEADLPEDPAFVRDRVRAQLELRSIARGILAASEEIKKGPAAIEKMREILAKASQPIDEATELLVAASEIRAAPVPWVWPGYIPRGMPVLIVGDPATNKSTVLVDYAARATTGRRFPGEPGPRRKPEGVVYLSAEDSAEYTIKPRFLAAGGDPRLFYLLKARLDGPMFTLEKDVPRLDAAIRATQARHLLVDPLNAFLPTTDTWKDNAIRSALRPLVVLAEQRDLGQVSVVHLNKKTEANALHRIMGSVGYSGMARAIYLVAVDPDSGDRRLFLCLKPSVMAKPPALSFALAPAVVRDGADGESIAMVKINWDTTTPVTLTAEEILRPARKKAPSLEEQAAQLTRELLAGGPVPATTMLAELEAAGFTEKTIERAKKRAGAQRLKAPGGEERPWYWAPPGMTLAQRRAWQEAQRSAGTREGE